MNKILVTGGSGLLGKSLRILHPEYTYLSSKDVDLRDRFETDKVLELHKPQADWLHTHGLYVGNNEFVTKEQINHLTDILNNI